MFTLLLSQGKTAIVSEEDYVFLSQHKWHINNSGYAVRNSDYARGQQRTAVLMHRAIVERMTGAPIPEGYQVDHIDMNKLNNQRGNLRLATLKQNKANSPVMAGTASGFKGVTWNCHCEKWVARIGCDNNRIHLGVFDNVEEAARAYDAKARELHGEFARLNFPDEANR